MHEQPLLTLWARNDLPPKWDGRRVDWSEWDTDPIFVCPPPTAPRCEGCGSAARQATSRGTVYPLDGEMFETHEPRVKRTRSGREYVAGTVAVARCMPCRRIVVRRALPTAIISAAAAAAARAP